MAGVLSPFLTVEEAFLMASYLKGLNPANVLALGPVPVRGEDQTFTPDQTAGRTGDTSFVVPRPFTIHAEKCPNRRGVEAILDHFQGEVIPFDDLRSRVDRGEFAGLYVASDSLDPWIDDDRAQALRSRVEFLVVQDTLVGPLAHLADVVLAGGTFAEKAGCYVNADGRLQYAEAALPPRDGALPDLDLFAILLGRPGGPGPLARGPGRARRDGPRLRRRRRGRGPRRSASSWARPEPVAVGASAARFSDPWTQPRFDKGDRPGEPTPKGGADA